MGKSGMSDSLEKPKCFGFYPQLLVRCSLCRWRLECIDATVDRKAKLPKLPEIEF
jgi:hypothetical protein